MGGLLDGDDVRGRDGLGRQFLAEAGRFSILLARGFGLVATPVYPVLRRAMLLYRPAQQALSSPAELFVSFTQEYARRHCLDSLPDDSLTALANTAG
ncbi:hypothetical protein [uncultured Desulfovibrio sp.]|uniref:hypothetical protein n=1 Tax=uncultured Desulfovibrio sp. TaxID=167968 RepID=UPI00265D12BC|nr:hypothetical protein [uncultured Desulfovibrio sp.]